ncbi:lipopolysaccharide biosynthesis protein [Polaribacter uvawellassae]|uniref:lipopolysaccharide biosynthesis protein n=1 Tax=Polaribacter uvawellassae TaxID=3133495 RepID=UPI003219E023
MNRKNIIFKNVSLGVFYKILNMAIVFTTIPLLLNYLEKEQYGIWVTIFSLVNIVFFVDAGIGNGLKTKLSEALSLKNFTLAKTYISTAYIAIFLISVLVLCIGIGGIFLINLQELFNTTISESELKTVLLVTLFLVITSFVLNLYKSFFYANQQASKVELAMLIYQLVVLLSTMLLLHFFPRKLLFVAVFYGVSNILVGLIFTILFFKKNKKIQPSIASFNRDKVKDLMGLSLAFFGIQLCMIVIFTTDNLIISKLLGPSEVTNYDVVYKLFQVVITISVIAQDPFWALYTDAFQKKDFKWIKKTIIRLNKLFIALIFLITGLFFISKPLIKIWIQRDLLIPTTLILFMSIFVLIRVYGIIYMTFLNSIGKVKLQLWLYIFGAIINIPLSIYFVKTFDLGSSGVILGTVFSILSLSLILPLQTFQILKKNEIN